VNSENDDDGAYADVDSKVRFTIEPLPGDDAFDQWRDGMKAVAGLPMGIPAHFRKKVGLWLIVLHIHFIMDSGIDGKLARALLGKSKLQVHGQSNLAKAASKPLPSP